MKLVDTSVAHLCNLLLRGFCTTAFQPVVETTTGRTIGYESFLRGPEGSALSNPGKVFSEQGGVPAEVRFQLDRMAIDSAVKTGRILPEHVLLFINVLCESIAELANGIEKFLALLAELAISPERIVVELSERSCGNGAENLLQYLTSIRRHGIRFALDNVGIRSPILYHLLVLRPDFIKLDWIFIKGINSNPLKRKLLISMVQTADRMGVRLVAGGVESRAELDAVRSAGVHLSQGFYLGHPQSAERWSLHQ